MSYQKCPICNGTGKTGEKLGYYGVEPDCPTCNGTRIISEITGLPPASAPQSDTNNNIDKPKSNLIQRLCNTDKYYKFICDFSYH